MEKVKEKILLNCEKYKVTPPVKWSYAEVKKAAEEINKKHQAAGWQREIERMNIDDSLWK